MIPRFYAPAAAPGATSVILAQAEGHHLARVMRLPAGSTVRVFNGRGLEWQGAVSFLGKDGVVVTDLRPVTPLPEAAVAIALVVSVVRGAAMDLIVRDATMLGVCAIVPVLSARSSVSRRPEALRGAHARWQRVAIAACKQCGRATLPDVAAPVPFQEAIAGSRAAVRLVLTEPAFQLAAWPSIAARRETALTGGAAVLIGPEGGWEADELSLSLEAGFEAWSLGPHVIRADVVPVAALSVLRYVWEGEPASA